MDPNAEPPEASRGAFATYAPWLVGIFSGAGWGIFMRLLAELAHQPGPHPPSRNLVPTVMTVSFLFVVPAVIGALAVRPFRDPSIGLAGAAGWLPCLLSVLVTWFTGFEGAICITMAFPLMLVSSSIGGLTMRFVARRHATAATYSALALPFLCAAIESRFHVPTSLRTVANEIEIAASAATVWQHIERVSAISPEELAPSLATRMGFPRPIEAMLDHEGVGGVRHATFEGGVLFIETITTWDEPRVLSFSITADTASIPPTTLDEHVTIGGPYFDVLQGTYTIEPRADGCVLHLESRLRVSTPFNLYAGPWADALMGSIQEQILHVLKNRCEKAAR